MGTYRRLYLDPDLPDPDHKSALGRPAVQPSTTRRRGPRYGPTVNALAGDGVPAPGALGLPRDSPSEILPEDAPLPESETKLVPEGEGAPRRRPAYKKAAKRDRQIAPRGRREDPINIAKARDT